MQNAILSHRHANEPEAAFLRRMAAVMRRRAGDQLVAGRNPEQAAMLAAEYTTRAQALEAETGQAVAR